MRKKTWVGLVGLALLSAGCASGPQGGFGDGGFRGGPPPGLDEGGEDGPPRARVQLFISPSGQPFRALPDQPYPSAAWFAAADIDHDDRLTRAEFRADAQAWFKGLDRDGDGQISMPEVSRWEEDLVPEILRGVGGGMGGPRAGGGGKARSGARLDGAAPYSLINEPHPIRGADADFSMTVSAREWSAAADRRFALLDIDKDGAVRAADLRPTPIQRAGRQRRKTNSDDAARPRSRGPAGARPTGGP
jgi:hypothetical protein